MSTNKATYSLAEIARHIGAELDGAAEITVEGINTLSSALPSQLSFFTDGRYRKQLEQTQAAAVIIAPDEAQYAPCAKLIIDKPYLAYAHAAQLFEQDGGYVTGIHPSAVVAEQADVASTASIGANVVIESGAYIAADVVIGANCFIGRNTRIGKGSRLMANVSLYHGVEIGCRARIHSGVVIGSDGFGFANEQGQWHKIPQLGGVVIGDDVEIGANTTIDRGALEDTTIGNGVKMDNQIQVAHNVRIGDHTAIAGCVGIAGSAKIGRFCGIGGGAGILGHLEIVDGVQVTAMSLVTKSIKQPGVYSSGTSVEPTQSWHKNYARFRHLDDMARRLKQLETKIEEQNKE